MTVATSPVNHDCTVSNGSGVVDGEDVTDVAVDCAYGDPPVEPVFEVQIDTDASTLEVSEGETAVVTAQVENTGDEPDEQDVEFAIEQAGVSETGTLALDPGETATSVFEWTTETGDAGEYTATVSTRDDDATTGISVEAPAPANFAVEIDEGASTLTVEENETVTVSADVENTGEQTGTRDVILEIGGAYADMASEIELAAGDTTTVELNWETSPGDAGDYTAEVLTGDESATTDVTVEQPTDAALFDVEIDEEASDLVALQGEPVSVEVTVTNTGDITGTQDISVEIGSAFSDSEASLELAGGESDTLTFQWTTQDGDAGNYTAEVVSDDDVDTAGVTVGVPGEDASLFGTVFETAPGGAIDGIDVVLYQAGSNTVVETTTTDTEGYYEFTGLTPGNYSVGLSAPGLEPNYELEEAGGENLLDIELVGGDNLRDLTLDWQKTFDLLVDGGMLDFQYGGDGDFSPQYPECEQQADGSWEPIEQNTDNDAEINYEPEGECFQINDVEVDLITGEMTVDTDDILFPDVTVRVESDESFIDAFEMELHWLFDDVQAQVDFTDGGLDVDLDLRILLGGTLESGFGDYDFGLRADFYDCQLAEAWGGDVSSPQTDDANEQIGDYLHDPMRMRTTTGDSGSNGESGTPYDYDADLGFAVTVDNEMTTDRLSEGQYGNDDPGGAACGDEDLGLETVDYAAEANNQLELPKSAGEVYGEFNFLLPLD